MTSIDKTVPDAPVTQEDKGFSEETAYRQLEQTPEEGEDRSPEGDEHDIAQQASPLLFSPPPGGLPPLSVLRRELERIEMEQKGWMEYEDPPYQYSAHPRRQRPTKDQT